MPAVPEGYVYKITSRDGRNKINAKLRECKSAEREMRAQGFISAVVPPALVAVGWRAIRDAGENGITHADIEDAMRAYAASAGHLDQEMIAGAMSQLRLPAKKLSDADYRLVR